jgi:hypothetical protein
MDTLPMKLRLLCNSESETAPRWSGFWISTKKPKDPTIREKFDTYRVADYKGKMIDLFMRVTRVPVETHRTTEAMRTATRQTPALSRTHYRSEVFQYKYTNLPASQSCSDLLKAILQELSNFHWE